MKKTILLAAFALLIAAPLFAQASYTGAQSAAITTVNIVAASLDANGAHITVYVQRADESVAKGFIVTVTDGDPATNADDWFSGSGLGGAPTGFVATIITASSTQTGGVKARLNKALMSWLITNRAAIRAAGNTIDPVLDDVTVP